MSMQAEQAIVGYIAGIVIATASLRVGLLSVSGAIGASIVGGTVFAFGGWPAGTALLTFFLTSSLLGRWRKLRKESLGFEKGGKRDIWQVLANGGVAALALAIGRALPAENSICWIVFLTALAEANADTWATEIGSASGATPRLITTAKPAPPGMSGAVSIPGLIAAFLGSVLISLFAVATPSKPAQSIIIVAFCGFAGALFDSVLGATIQAQYYESETGRLVEKSVPGTKIARGIAGINNDLVNALSTIFASALAITCHYLLLNAPRP